MTDSGLCKVVLTVLCIKKFLGDIWNETPYTCAMAVIVGVGALFVNLTTQWWACILVFMFAAAGVVWFLLLDAAFGDKDG